MKHVLLKILDGFLYGIGITIILGVAYYFLCAWVNEKTLQGYGESVKLVELVEHRKIERDGKLLILGQVINKGEDDARGVRVAVDLYQGDEFVHQCDTTIDGALSPGETRNFELACGGGCSRNPIVKHDSYKTYLTGW